MEIVMAIFLLLTIAALLTVGILAFLPENRTYRISAGLIIALLSPLAFFIGASLGGIGGGVFGAIVSIGLFFCGVSIFINGLLISSNYKHGALEKERKKTNHSNG